MVKLGKNILQNTITEHGNKKAEEEITVKINIADHALHHDPILTKLIIFGAW